MSNQKVSRPCRSTVVRGQEAARVVAVARCVLTKKYFKIFLFGFLRGNQATKCKQTPFSPITRVERIIVDLVGHFGASELTGEANINAE